MPLPAVAAVVCAYLIGSIPFALLLARRWSGADLRRIGSGNLGAANVVRASGIGAGLIVLALDAAKGAAGVLIAQRLTLGATPPAVAGIAAIVGHIYPIWLGFRGGKGVATACGVFAVLTPLAVPPAVAVFVAAVWVTKYISVGSILATIAVPPIALAAGHPQPAVTAAAAAGLLILFRHRTNVMRLLAGTERRIGLRA